MRAAALLQFGCIVLHPAVDRGVIDVQSSLAHHLLQIPVAQWIPEVPADAEQNEISLEVTPFECLEVSMKWVPLGFQNTIEFTAYLPFS
jgi:hypothetical protein